MSDTTFDTTPLWYGGPEGILKNSLERGRNLYRSEYQPYAGQRTAPFNDTQRKGFELAGNEANNPFYSDTFGQAGGAIRNALGQDVSQFIQNAIGPTNIDEFRNPYEQRILQNLQSEGNRNLQENLLPNINTKFIGAGQYGSTGHQDLTNRAIRDTQEGISKASGAALHAGYNTALQAALQKQESNLNAGQLAGKDIERQMLGAEALQNLAGSQQNSELKKIALMGQVGGQQQQQEQNEKNVQYQEFQNEANFPYLQQARETEMIRGQPVSTQKIYDSVNPTPPQQPQASPYTQAGGMVMGLTGAMNQRPQGFAKGGVVKSLTSHRHFAEGGSLSPIQQGANHAIDTAELQSMRHQANKLSKPDVDPFWSSIARAGFNVAANRQPGVLAKLGEAGGAGLDEYHSQLGRQDNRGLQSANIMNLIDNTRRLQAENNRKHQFETEKFGQHQKEFGMSHGLEREKLGLEKEKFEHTKVKDLGGDGGIGGIGGISPEYRKMKAKEEAKSDVKHMDELSKKAESARESIETTNQILNNIDEAKTGPLFDLRQWAGNTAQSLGIDLPEGIDLGKPAAMLEVEKGLINLGMKTAKEFNPNKPTDFDLKSALKGLPKSINSPETLKQVLETRNVFSEYKEGFYEFSQDWESKFGSTKKKSPNGLSVGEAYGLFAKSHIWPKIQEINKKYKLQNKPRQK